MKIVFETKNDVDEHDSEATEHSLKTLTTINEKQSWNDVKFGSRHEQDQMKTVLGTIHDVDIHVPEATERERNSYHKVDFEMTERPKQF